MAFVLEKQTKYRTREVGLMPGFLLMGIVLGLIFAFVLFNSGITETFPYFFLLPWLIPAALIILAPTYFLYRKNRFFIFDPIIFATLTNFFPAFVVGSFVLAAGWSQPYFLSFIPDADYNLPYTLVLVTLGFASLAIGYFSPIGVQVGARISSILPTRDFEPHAILLPGIILLVVSLANTWIGHAIGVLGFQRLNYVDPYVGLIQTMGAFWMQSMFILWYYLFQRRKLDLSAFLLGAPFVLVLILKSFFSGNRAGFMHSLLIVVMAFSLSGRKASRKQILLVSIILVVSLGFGMIYASTFRILKGSEAAVSIEQYSQSMVETFSELGRSDVSDNLEYAGLAFAERIDALSTVAVVVSNHEELQPFEESYGLDNNIMRDLTTFFVPRFMWHDKPLASEPRAYTTLYFDNSESSFLITPTGDLLRNFGVIGIPIGMFIFGIIIRLLYRTFVEGQPQSLWRRCLYFLILMSISYEGFYGGLIPTIVKVAFTGVIGLILLYFVARAIGYRPIDVPLDQASRI